MSSIKDRQRAAARARLEKEMAERAEAARKRRQKQAIIGSAIAVVVIAGVAVWLVSSLGSDDDTKTNAAAPPAGTVACKWIPESGDTGAKVKDVGTPPPNAPNTGTDTLTMSTNLGAITATVDRSKVPCTAAAFEYLASKNFWDNTKCHRLVTEGIKVLQCGDPTATGKGYRDTDGTGGPSFRYAEENLPTSATPAYPEGTLAMAKTQAASSTGSQFFIVYGDTELPPDYTVLGKVTKGMEIVKDVAKAGSDDANQPGDGHPKKEVVIKDLTMAAA
ncbi:peptidylprolyl isomerase [Mangrovihabitans endophyticus]|uniref:peptidylprolyl isomerase n=1 Tax=Mangrovihabitans endophyticus TaxID=1751298 RepID=A0A8J3BYS9_9ACTN|nr:peptidylprolyl isomerase [Mangrovihabitans endophyticus]GGK85657.1 peptidylprolyl isomerase [Mangrovihabitans endophyticus]